MIVCSNNDFKTILKSSYELCMIDSEHKQRTNSVLIFSYKVNWPTDISENIYRKVASTNASRFEARLVYMHTQKDNFLIRSPSWI